MAESQSMDKFLEFFRSQFYQEAEELLERAESILLELENSPDNSESMNELFRIFHTMKGNAGMAHEESIQNLCHIYENQLDSIRNGHVDMSSDFFEDTLRVIDLLRYSVSNENPPEIAALLREEYYRMQTMHSSSVASELTDETKGSAPSHTSQGSASAAPASQHESPGLEDGGLSGEQDETSEFHQWLLRFRRSYSFVSSVKKILTDRDCDALFEFLDRHYESNHVTEHLNGEITDDFPRLRSAFLLFLKSCGPVYRHQIVPGEADFHDLQTLFERLIEDFEEDLAELSWFSSMPLKRLRDFKAFQRIYRKLPPIVFIRLSIPYERLLRDASAFDIIQHMIDDPNQWIAFIFTRSGRLGKAAALLEWGLSEKSAVFYSSFDAGRILLDDRNSVV